MDTLWLLPAPNAGDSDDAPPPPPTTCCMSGCANCVWLDYAEEVVRFYRRRGEDMDEAALMAEVDRGLDDEMVKAFVRTEVRAMVKKGKTEEEKKS